MKQSISRKLLGATLLPSLAAFVAFGLLAHWSARRALDDELGRHLVSIAQTAALAVQGERIDLLAPGDESSRAYLNIRRKLSQLCKVAGVKRVYLFDVDGNSRGDTEPQAIGFHYYALDAHRSELGLVFAGQPATSVLFSGYDGGLYKSGFAPCEVGSARFGVGVDGSAELYSRLKGLRHTILFVGGLGLMAIALLSIVVARLITRPLQALERAARTIGGGDLARPIAVSSNDEIGFLSATLESMRKQLQARDERLHMMLAGIAHEVRNPLGGMELFAGLLRGELAGQPAALEQVHRIERELGHLKTVVAEFLDYARRPSAQLQPADAAALLREVEPLLVAEADRAHVNLFLAAPVPVPIRCDPPQLRRALLNLGKNALEACAPGDRVTLGCGVESGQVRLTVADTGRGIPPEQQREIFAPFFTTRERGTGLGLAFVAEIAREHGGTISVDSTVGVGSVFTLELPLGA